MKYKSYSDGNQSNCCRDILTRFGIGFIHKCGDDGVVFVFGGDKRHVPEKRLRL